jgi:hypothetical protein
MVGRSASPGVPRDRQIRGKTTIVDWSEGQEHWERPVPASCRVHRCASQEPWERQHPQSHCLSEQRAATVSSASPRGRRRRTRTVSVAIPSSTTDGGTPEHDTPGPDRAAVASAVREPTLSRTRPPQPRPGVHRSALAIRSPRYPIRQIPICDCRHQCQRPRRPPAHAMPRHRCRADGLACAGPPFRTNRRGVRRSPPSVHKSHAVRKPTPSGSLAAPTVSRAHQLDPGARRRQRPGFTVPSPGTG